MTYELKPSITLHDRRCYSCGRYWACESSTAGTCPHCADERIDRAIGEQRRLERVVRALRGAVTRAAHRRTARDLRRRP